MQNKVLTYIGPYEKRNNFFYLDYTQTAHDSICANPLAEPWNK